jgi:hypothetical protein
MTDFTIPCDTFVRLARVLAIESSEPTPWFRSVRIDNEFALASNRIIMAVEHISRSNVGVVHIVADPALIAQCANEAPFKSVLTITVNELLKYAVAKTTLGYVHPTNCVVWSDEPNDFDRWRSVVDLTRQPAAKPSGGMYWSADNIANLAASSPSGRIIFEEIIDCTGDRPTIVRDVNDYEWFGIFQPFVKAEHHNPATLPSWMVSI